MRKFLITFFIFLTIFGLISLSISFISLFGEKTSKKIYFPEKTHFGLGDGGQNFILDGDNLILVDLGGAIMNPGPYQVKKNTYLYELIELAGGFNSFVDKEYLSKNFNLVEELTSSQKIYVPFRSESSISNDNSTDQISINEASASELEKLPKIGEITAQKILDSRPFQKLSDLVDEKIISQKNFEEIEKNIKL